MKRIALGTGALSEAYGISLVYEAIRLLFSPTSVVYDSASCPAMHCRIRKCAR